MSNMKKGSIALIMAGILSGSGCDDGGQPQSEEGTVDACAFESFSVELTAGPSAPLMLEGTLYLAGVPGAEGALRGLFEVGDKQYPVSSQYEEDGDISVSVAVDGGYVVGLGRAAKLCEKGGRIEGVAVGPTVGVNNTIEGTDSGHWLLYDGTLLTLDYLYGFDSDTSTKNVTIKIPITEVCTQNNATKASCYENFCQAQKAGHYTQDPATGDAVCR